MAIIKSGTFALGEFSRISTGGFGVTPIDDSGRVLYKNPIASIFIRIPNARLTAAVAAGSLIWALRYNGANKLRLRAFRALASFDGTAAASTSEFQFVRISAANTTGGTAITPQVVSTTMVLPTVDARFNYAAALGVVGVTIDADYFAEWGVQRQVSANNNLDSPRAYTYPDAVIDLAAGEGIAIRLGVVAVIGDGLGGFLQFDEVATTD
jgi:hypothetical protein